jgi:hypothetical protein
MGRELGRISGPLLADNLLRRGQNLAFETQLLYFDVVNNRVGINNTANAVNVNLFISTTTNSQFLDVSNESDLANFIVSGNTINNGLGSITIQPNQTSNPTIVAPSVSTDNLNFGTNIIQNTLASDNINISATGKIVLNSNTLVTGDLHATGNITFDGNITLGNSNSDTVTFGADINSDILPNLTDNYNLGSLTNVWLSTYSNNVNTDLTNINSFYSNYITIGNINFSNNRIQTNTPGGTIQLAPDGGVVNFLNFVVVKDNTITNISNGALTFAATSNSILSGHYNFKTGDANNAGINALVIPINSTADYTPEEGTIRYNPIEQNGEVYSTSQGWINWVGPASSLVTTQQFNDTSLVYTLMLGL